MENTTEVAFEVPYLTPPSVNHYKKPVHYVDKRTDRKRMGFRLTKEAQAYKDAVARFARGQTVTPQSPAELRKVRYEVEATIYLGKRQRLDSDNAGKVVCDALQYAGVIHSDAFVTRSIMNIDKDDRENPRTFIRVVRL